MFILDIILSLVVVTVMAVLAWRPNLYYSDYPLWRQAPLLVDDKKVLHFVETKGRICVHIPSDEIGKYRILPGKINDLTKSRASSTITTRALSELMNCNITEYRDLRYHLDWHPSRLPEFIISLKRDN